MIELISIHIPKTAGRSFLSILKSVYGNNRVAHFEAKNYTDKAIPEFEQYKSQLQNETKVIHGHIQYNEIKSLPDVNSAKVITWLRNPVERVISNYSFFIKRAHESTDDAELIRRKNESLIEYASLENSRNRMSKFTAGLDINKYYFVGIMEYFNEDIFKLAEKLNWQLKNIPRINDNTEFKSTLPNATSEERKTIEELNKIDIELYNWVLEIHKKRII